MNHKKIRENPPDPRQIRVLFLPALPCNLPVMARILFTVTPAAGHLHPTIPIALALQARGHDVRYCTGLSKVALLERQGLPATAILRGRADTPEQITHPVGADRDTYNPLQDSPRDSPLPRPHGRWCRGDGGAHRRLATRPGGDRLLDAHRRGAGQPQRAALGDDLHRALLHPHAHRHTDLPRWAEPAAPRWAIACATGAGADCTSCCAVG
jgi:hypothetical protein